MSVKQIGLDFDQLPTVPATPKQRNYIGALIDDLGWHSEQLAMYAHELNVDLVSMSMVQAGALIDGLKRLAEGKDCFRFCDQRGCGRPFITTDASRKYCDLCLPNHINGAGILEDDDEPGLFDTPPPTRRPILALIQCRVCGNEARIPILADAKICDACLSDLPGITARIEATLDSATARSFNAELDLHALIADAGEQTLARYQNAVALREANDPRIAAAWAKALAASDALAALLAAHDAQVTATSALSRLLAHSEVALAEIAKVHGA